MKKTRFIKYAISICAIVIAIIHIIFPELEIDSILLMLILISIIPWLTPLFKSLELPGGLKFEFQELEKVKDEAKKVGLIKETTDKEISTDYPFLIVARTDPNLSLAGFRIEIEKRLRRLAEQYNIKSSRKGLRDLINDLYNNHALTNDESSTLKDLIDTLNKAARGQDFDLRVGNWVIENGPSILNGLDGKFKNVEARSQKYDYNMSGWGHEKSEMIVKIAANIIDEVKSNLSNNTKLKEEIIGYLSYLLHDATKIYSFFCNADWETRDSELIINEGKKGFEKLYKRYNRTE